MQFKLLALSAFAASVTAQSSLNPAAVTSILLTALPSSVLLEAATNPAAFASEVRSEFSAGETPTWFTALPTPVQSYLLGAGASGVSNATGVLNGTMASSSSGTAGTTGKTTLVTGGRTTTIGSGNTNTAAGASSSSAGSSSSGNGAMPTQVIGAGLAGAAGLVGLLVL